MFKTGKERKMKRRETSYDARGRQVAFWKAEAQEARKEAVRLRKKNAAPARGRERVISAHGKDYADRMFVEFQRIVEREEGETIERVVVIE